MLCTACWFSSNPAEGITTTLSKDNIPIGNLYVWFIMPFCTADTSCGQPYLHASSKSPTRLDSADGSLYWVRVVPFTRDRSSVRS